MRLFTALLFLAAAAPADVRECACDAARPESLEARPCGLCREVEKAPPETAVIFLKDINPTKPNRWLALPRVHVEGRQALSGMTAAGRTAFWTAAIEKARSLWGDQWGLAMNGDESRTQCHMHAHIGKLLDGVETTNFLVVDGPGAIPVPRDGTGLWIHAAGGRLHVHLGEQIAETVLVR